jgi:hypothetical protein
MPVFAIAGKEFVKIRWFWAFLLVLNGLLMAFIALETRRLFALDHSEIVWYRVIHLGQIHYSSLKYAPALTGLLIAFIQYLPEMVAERLRLSLHLPISAHRVIMAHLGVGLAALSLIIGLDLAALALLTRAYFPAEVVTSSVLTALPWSVAGVAAYLGVALAMLEPSSRFRIVNLALAAGVTWAFFYPADAGGYNSALPVLVVPVLIMIPAVLLPAFRFRYRRAT